MEIVIQPTAEAATGIAARPLTGSISPTSPHAGADFHRQQEWGGLFLMRQNIFEDFYGGAFVN